MIHWSTVFWIFIIHEIVVFYLANFTITRGLLNAQSNRIRCGVPIRCPIWKFTWTSNCYFFIRKMAEKPEEKRSAIHATLDTFSWRMNMYMHGNAGSEWRRKMVVLLQLRDCLCDCCVVECVCALVSDCQCFRPFCRSRWLSITMIQHKMHSIPSSDPVWIIDSLNKCSFVAFAKRSLALHAANTSYSSSSQTSSSSF